MQINSLSTPVDQTVKSTPQQIRPESKTDTTATKAPEAEAPIASNNGDVGSTVDALA